MIDLETKLVNSDGKEVFCACGNKSIGFITSQNYVKVFCEKCSILETIVPVDFKYDPPKNMQDAPSWLKESFVINLQGNVDE